MGYQPSQQHAGLQHAIWQLQQEITRPKPRFKPTLLEKSRWMGEQSGANISWWVPSPCTPMMKVVWLDFLNQVYKVYLSGLKCLHTLIVSTRELGAGDDSSWLRPILQSIFLKVRIILTSKRFLSRDLEPVWPDLAKCHHFAKILKFFGNRWRVCLVFSEFLSLLWQTFC